MLPDPGARSTERAAIRERMLPLLRVPTMDFLLECIGFPPTTDLAALAERIRREGETVALRGPGGEHLRVPLAGGLEVRLDREPGAAHDSIWPYYEVPRRLRVAVESLQGVPDSPYDVLLRGRANPPLPEDPWREANGDEYPFATYLCDARRLPRGLARGHVLAVSVSGFALDVTYVGPNEGVRNPYLGGEPGGATLLPLAGSDQPGGCMELSLVVRGIRHLENPLTGEPITLVETDAPGRPLDLFLSRWQLAASGLEAPRAGWRVEGAFLFTGRASGGLPARPARA